jgi:hypothetical protein
MPQKLPEILSREEVGRIIGATRTLRERLMLMLACGGGLRLSEILHLRWGDLDRGVSRIASACLWWYTQKTMSGRSSESSAPARPTRASGGSIHAKPGT